MGASIQVGRAAGNRGKRNRERNRERIALRARLVRCLPRAYLTDRWADLRHPLEPEMRRMTQSLHSPVVRPLTPTLGAEILDIDLEHLDQAGFELIRDALTEHLVVFFRDQDISIEAHKALGARFGTLDVHPNDPGLEGHPEVMVIHADANSKRVAGEMWHSDVSCASEPPMGSILRMRVVPPSGGDTLFASMYAAWDALSGRMKAFLEGLTAVHDGGPYYRDVNTILGRDDGGKTYPRSEHPVVRTHPVSGRKCLFVNSMFTTRILGLPKSESDAVLAFLFDHVKTPAFQCRFHWQPHSIAFWDNRCTQHYAVWDYFPQTRSGYRVTVRGERPV
jgi:alpha-ketoglutarate-dependent taurine dioxygenase